MKCNELSVPTYEVSVSCGSYCYGGSAVFAPTSYPEHTEADDFVWVKGCDAAALQARLAELQAAAWDVHDLVYSALDTPEDADLKAIRKALDAMGELIPAQRPADSADVAPCKKCYGTGAIDAPTSADDPSCPECDGEGRI